MYPEGMAKKLDPKVAVEVMLKAGLKPLEPYKNSITNWKCLCNSCGNTVYPKYDKIKSGRSGCRDCAFKKNGENRKLSSSHVAEVMNQANFEPMEPYIGADKKWKCKCLKCGAISYPRLASVKKGTKCSICMRKEGADKTRISQEESVAVMLNAGLKPLEPYKGASSPWRCQCIKCGKTVSPRLASIKRGSGGCEFCGGSAKDPVDAVAVMVRAGLEPLEPYKSANVKWKCRHAVCGSTVYPRYSDVNSGKGGCNPCAQKKSLDAKRIPPLQAEAKMLENGFRPLTPFIDTNRKWESLCLKCNKVSSPRYSQAIRGHDCPYCSGNKVDEEDAINLMLQAHLKPQVPYKSALTKWKCECLKCHKIVYPKYASIQSGQLGCRYCASKGINMNTPSYLYLITNNILNAHKVGMGNHKKLNDRLGRFIKEGWETFRVWDMESGADAIDVEKKVFQILRKEMNIPVYLSKEDMPKTEGHTETVSSDEISLPALERIIKKVIREHLNQRD